MPRDGIHALAMAPHRLGRARRSWWPSPPGSRRARRATTCVGRATGAAARQGRGRPHRWDGLLVLAREVRDPDVAAGPDWPASCCSCQPGTPPDSRSVPMLGQVVHVAGARGLDRWHRPASSVLATATGTAGRGPPPCMRTLVPRFSALALAVHRSRRAHRRLPVVPGDRHAARPGNRVRPYVRSSRGVVAVAAVALGGLNYLDGGRMRGWLDGSRSESGRGRDRRRCS